MHKLPSILQKKWKTNQLRVKALNYTCFKMEEKTIWSVKKNKKIFINVIGDKSSMSIREKY